MVDDVSRRAAEFRARLEQARVPFDEIQSVTPSIEDLFVETVQEAGKELEHGSR